MMHTCHYPGCATKVVANVWCCKPHWEILPDHFKDRIQAAYKPGQEIFKGGKPSEEYDRLKLEIDEWCRESLDGAIHPASKRKDT
jgi:hypothetical protein